MKDSMNVSIDKTKIGDSIFQKNNEKFHVPFANHLYNHRLLFPFHKINYGLSYVNINLNIQT